MCAAMMTSLGVSVYSDNEEEAAVEEAAEDTSSSEEASDDEPAEVITEEQAFAEMELVTENDKLALYRSSERNSTSICLVDKNSGKKWFSNPVNAVNSNAKKAQKNDLLSGMSLVYAEPADRRTTTVNSKAKGDVTVENVQNGIKITYKFTECGITVPVTITLESDHLKLYCNTSEIVEEHPSTSSGKLTSTLSFMTSFGAADRDTEGYFVIPDGSGALINFNNNKTGYKVYTGPVYGSDITPVKTTKSYVSENVYLNMFGIVEGDSGLVVVADKGDTAASINAYVAGEINTDYNGCYFSFETRTSDEYLMGGGESNPLKVFEKHGILVPEIELRYYPVSSDDGSDIDYIDIADTYRDYLTGSCGVKTSSKVDENPLYVNFYGATIKKKSILGIPVNVKEKVTGFDDALDILEELGGYGVDGMVVSYKDWTGTDIGEKITDKASPAGTLGGSSKFNKLMDYAESNNIAIYPDVENMTFKSSLKYMTITNTSIRVSNAYSRQIVYDLAHGVENKYYKSMSLFSPASYDKAYTNLINSYQKKKISNISLGSLANTIYGDYGKKAVSREMSKGIIEDIYSNAQQNVGSVMADGGNKYVLPYVDTVSNIPISSSKYDIFDQEIPFYQIVLHGLIPCSTTAINSEPDIADAVLTAISCGSNLTFDLIGTEASELKDTRYDRYFYAYYGNWTEDAAGAYRLQNDILSDVADQKIVEYNISADGNEIETVYEDNTTTVVNFENDTVKLNGTTYKLSDYFSEGVVG
ncbi:MAG: DUF5696 domain-containing protein [Oscillospiraceae bacterium]